MRYIYQGHFKDQSGNIVIGGTVTIYLANSTTLATIYDVISGGSAITSSAITTDAYGYFNFYVDTKDYANRQRFKIVLSKTGFRSQTYDYIAIYPETESNEYNVIDYGADNTNTDDNTTILNQVFTDAAVAGGRVVFPAGQYKVLGALFINGSVDIIGMPGSSLEFPATGSDYSSTYSVSASIPEANFIMGPVTTWTGKFTGMTLNYTGAFNDARALAVDAAAYDATIFVMAIWSADHFEVSGNNISGMLTDAGSGLSACWGGSLQNTTATLLQSNGVIKDNTYAGDASNVGMEFSSMNVNSHDITWIGNRASGYGDDSIATHSGYNYVIDGNFLNPLKGGRILVEGTSENVVISNNVIRKVDGTAAGAGIMLTNGTDTSDIRDITVTGNVIINDDTVYAMTYPIILRGGTNIVIDGNLMVNNLADTQFEFRATEFTPTAVTHYLTNVQITNNVIVGGGMMVWPGNASGADHHVSVYNNHVDGKGYDFGSSPYYAMDLKMYTERGEYCSNNTGINGLTGDIRLQGTAYAMELDTTKVTIADGTSGEREVFRFTPSTELTTMLEVNAVWRSSTVGSTLLSASFKSFALIERNAGAPTVESYTSHILSNLNDSANFQTSGNDVLYFFNRASTTVGSMTYKYKINAGST